MTTNTNKPSAAKQRIPYTETIGAMITEIQKMQDWCSQPANYESGYDTFVECYSSEDFEDLFYDRVWDEASCDYVRGARITFADAWDLLHSMASVYAERQADARNSAF